MKILKRYLSKTIIASIFLIVVLLAGMEIFIIFLKQLGDIGHGQFTTKQAFFYAMMQVPYQIYLFFPIASLLGSLMGLGLLSQHSELIVMRAAGVSIGQISRAVVKIAFVILLFVTVVGEVFVPRLLHFSDAHKAVLMSGGQSLKTSEGLWVRVNNSFIHINESLDRNHIKGISQYFFDGRQQLTMARHAMSGEYRDRQWTLFNISETHFNKSQLRSKSIDSMHWSVNLKPKTLMLSSTDPEEMTLVAMYRYIKAQHKNHVATERYQLNFWQRIFQPLASCVMMLLAIPFIFGPLRSATMGSRFLAGASIGFSFHILNRFFGPISLVYQFPPLLAAILPTGIFILLALWMMRRVR